MDPHDSDSDSNVDSGASVSSIEHPPSFNTTMASHNPPRRRNSKDEPPNMLCEMIRLKEEFIGLYERDHLELQQCIKRLSGLISIFERDFRRATEHTRDGGIVGIVGGVTMIAGLALAPFTLGASAIVGGAGAAVALGGGISSGILNYMKRNHQKEMRQIIENRLEEFQNKVSPMTDILKVICQYSNEILSHLNKPERDISAFSKFVASTSEILRFIRIDDIGEVAAQMSKTVRLTGTLTGIFAGVGLVLDILSVIEDNKALDDMDNLAKNFQINESEIKSKAGKFIVEMRKVIHELQKVMDELKKTKDIFLKRMDLMTN